MIAPAPALQARLQQALGGSYAVERELGAGGMARVFLATERDTGHRLAVKVLAPAVASCCDAERFRREMSVAASLAHPNIVPLLRECDVCGDERLFYFVMPYVEGETLRARLDREGALPVAQATGILADVASALAHAHGTGVVHRDIKPANVLLSRGRALVTDFGIAKALASAMPRDAAACAPGCGAPPPDPAAGGLTTAGYMVGTPAYAAPEQAVGDPDADHRADLYALGVLGYEMLAGRPPFGDRPPLALIAAHVAESPPPLPARDDLPPALAALVLRLLAKRPEHRFQSADEVLRALGELARRSASSPPSSPP